MNINKILKNSQRLRKNAKTLSSKLKSPIQDNNQNTKPVIAVWGLLNAGKSTLLNMLTEHIDKEYFKTNDFRETTQISSFEDANCIYMDTPGLDANEQDNAVALQGVAQANVVLFVHQLQGELEAVEVAFLKELKKSFGEYASQNIFIVLSKIDKESAQKVDSIQSRILEQCEELGFSPRCFQISNNRYKKGKLENKQSIILPEN